jgi:Family of unknown function (DUF6519)
MKGDFSKWGLKPTDNFSGVLHQQGRVLLDQDWNASTQIQALWKETVGQDVIGDGLVAVPAAEPDSLKVLSASATAIAVDVVLQTGRAWVDGVHLHYDSTVPLHAEYFLPPFQAAPVTTIAAGDRDAVVLEVWDEAFSAYQAPLELLEPALGGPDTTERVKTCMAVKLLRLADGQDCGDLPINDVFANKGKLTVTPSPTAIIAGPCPVPDSGGYTGFEHYLYRIEIATPTPNPANEARFKWSQFNGGLVGRGQFTAGGASNTGTVAITANSQMINQCGLDSFYLEALAFDPAFGHWRIVCTASASLVSSDTLSLTALSGAWPTGTSGFFRLWNGIELISNHPTGLAIPNPFNDGIRLEFEPAIAGNANYTPGDYWTFPARAASVTSNPAAWPTAAPPQGVHYHRAALGVLEWTGPAPVNLTPDAIHDCRQVFLPLAKMKGCCTVTVGDGKHSFGQFKSVQAAVNALPAKGGTVCVLKGIYDESILIEKRVNIRIHGCGSGTRIRAVADATGNPLPTFMIRKSDSIILEDIAIESGPRSAVQIDKSRKVTVKHCLIQMRDLATTWQAIYSRGDDILISENIIEVLPRPILTPPPAAPVAAPVAVAAPAAEATAEVTEAIVVTSSASANKVNLGSATRGGIQLAGGSERVRILDNLIQGGIWNGITLGSLIEVNSETDEDFPDIPGKADPCDPCKPADITDDEDPQGGPPKFVSAGDLYDINIERNRITDMGMNGIAVARFFDLANKGDLIGVNGLHIYDNFITRCMRRDIAKVRKAMEWLVAYGGIALAKVSDLRILRNEIIHNGPNHRVPICGVYAIMVQGLQIDDNRIIDNGHRSSEPVENIQSGIRGGVHVWIVAPNVTLSTTPKSSFATDSINATASASRLSMDNGGSTVLMRDNIVVAPVGRAVTFFALGPVVVARNRLVTQGTTSKGLDLLATTTLIGNLGISNEWTLGLLFFLVLKLIGKLPEGINSENECSAAKLFGLINPFSKPPSFWPPVARQWATGKTLFTENQVTFDVTDEPFAFAISAIAILSLDDLGFTDNQCEISSTNFFVLIDAVLGASSVRVANNRFSETWMRTFFSGFIVGGMNITSDNQSTHCLDASAFLPGNMLVFKDNIALVEAFCPGACKYGESNFK